MSGTNVTKPFDPSIIPVAGITQNMQVAQGTILAFNRSDYELQVVFANQDIKSWPARTITEFKVDLPNSQVTILVFIAPANPTPGNCWFEFYPKGQCVSGQYPIALTSAIAPTQVTVVGTANVLYTNKVTNESFGNGEQVVIAKTFTIQNAQDVAITAYANYQIGSAATAATMQLYDGGIGGTPLLSSAQSPTVTYDDNGPYYQYSVATFAHLAAGTHTISFTIAHGAVTANLLIDLATLTIQTTNS